MSSLTSPIQNCSGSPSECNKTRKRNKSLHIEKKEIRLYLQMVGLSMVETPK